MVCLCAGCLCNSLGDTVQSLAFNPVTHHLLSCSSVDVGMYMCTHKHTYTLGTCDIDDMNIYRNISVCDMI